MAQRDPSAKGPVLVEDLIQGLNEWRNIQVGTAPTRLPHRPHRGLHPAACATDANNADLASRAR